jgi:hypothetical protein
MTFPQRPLAHFRAELYQTFGRRRDALHDLLDAVLTRNRVSSRVGLSVVPAFRRRWPSVGDALADGTLDVAALRRLYVRTLPRPAEAPRPLWAIDGSTWPRPEAKTSPERTCCRFVTAGVPESGIVPGWEYQWLVAIPESTGSWVLPLDVSRRRLEAGTPSQLAITQLRAVLAAAERPTRPVVVLDSHYDVPALVAAVPEVDLLARLARNRRFYRLPPAYDGKGRPRVHGPVFRLGDPATHHAPDAHQVDDDPAYGRVTIELWAQLHTQPAPDVAVTVIRVSVAHLPRHQTSPKPLWLVWHGDALPDDLRDVWRWYQRRFAIEHAFRFLKQDLGWTRPHLRSPPAADRWSWLLASALWQVWLARAQIRDARLPWERPTDPAHLSPGRVRRGMAGLLTSLGTPARPPRPRGKAPGRQRGSCPGRAPRFPVHRRAPPDPVSAP